MEKNDHLKLNRILASVFNVPVEKITEEASMDTVPQWDSVNHLKLVLALEDSFQISFTEEETVELISYPLIQTILKDHGIVFS